jgi:hypothetical protein
MNDTEGLIASTSRNPFINGVGEIGRPVRKHNWHKIAIPSLEKCPLSLNSIVDDVRGFFELAVLEIDLSANAYLVNNKQGVFTTLENSTTT